MILACHNLQKAFGEQLIVKNGSFHIEEHEKAALIGPNGAGKSTILKMIMGEVSPDGGEVILAKGKTIGYLSQHQELMSGNTIFEEVKTAKTEIIRMEEQIRSIELELKHLDGEELEKRLHTYHNLTALFERENGYAYQSEIVGVLKGLGFTEKDFKKQVDTLSGGQKTRVSLGKLLLTKPDVLLLDEPTNHLDNEMITWLEDYLRKYKGVIIMVTHDRYFLDKVTNRILEISRGNLYSYEANYTKFLEMKAQREEMEQASERKRQSVLRMELEWAKRGCRARTTKQKARLERLETLKSGVTPAVEQTAEIDSVETRMGKKTIELHHISKSYGEKKMIEDFDYIVLKNQNLGIVGPNGCGKSTLLKIIAGLVEPDSGTVEIGETIRIGYFAQEIPELDTKQKVIDYVKDIAEYIPTRDGRITASQMLERFLFTPEMQYGQIGNLSGGEKKRLYLLSVLQSAPNVLIFDEANNDIDIPTMTILEDYINSFQGIVITVSHDRYFLDNVVDRIFEFDGTGHLKQYEGGYTDYVEAKQRENRAEKTESTEKKTSGKKEWKQNQPTKLKFTYMEQREYETIDEDIASLEEKIEQLDADMMKYATNSVKLSEITAEKEEIEQKLEEKMERWVYLNDLAERIEEQKKQK